MAKRLAFPQRQSSTHLEDLMNVHYNRQTDQGRIHDPALTLFSRQHGSPPISSDTLILPNGNTANLSPEPTAPVNPSGRTAADQTPAHAPIPNRG